MDDTCRKWFDDVTNILDELTENPDLLLEPQEKNCKKFKSFTKFLYDKAVGLQNGGKISSRALPKLLVKGFDTEQIWQQLELENDDAIKYFQDKLSWLSREILGADRIDKDASAESAGVAGSESGIDSSDENDGYVFDDDDEESDEEGPGKSRSSQQVSAAVFSDGQPDVKSPKTVRRTKNASEVDDQFFRLSEMEEFLKMEDLKEERGTLSGDEKSEEINLFEDIPSDDLEGMDIEDGSDDELSVSVPKSKKTMKDLMYEDFFDPPESGDEDIAAKDDDDEIINKQKDGMEYDTRDYVFEDEDDQSDEERHPVEEGNDMNQGDDQSNKEEADRPKTAFEKQQEKEHKRILEMEESLLKPKPWQLTGEVAAANRPQNSLVYQPTTFDSNIRQELITTEELTAKVEEIVRMAIKNKAWNDVERKVKPVVEQVTPFKKPIEIDQTKSKKGLAEVYEEEYLKVKSKTDTSKEDDPRHVEIKKLMDQLVPELNALFAFIPKPPVPEIKVVNNLPAVTLEEVAPVALSDAALLAPEEIKKRMSGEIKGKTERTDTDKKRERRKKKAFQRMKQKIMEEKMLELSATSPAIAKQQEKLMALKKLKQSKNARIVGKNETAKVKSSKDFFSRLDDVTRSKSNLKQRKKDTNTSSVKLKEKKN